MKRTVILINGKGGSGKDTLAKMLLNAISKHTKESCGIVHNAEEVKKLARTFYKWDNKKDDKGRKLLIDITNSGYNYDPQFWEKKSLNFIIEHNILVTLIPDWRYMSTFDLFKDNNFNVITLYLNRVKLNNNMCEELKNDKSEQKFKDFSYDYEVINKNDSLETLEQMVNEIFVPQLIKRMEL